MTKEEIITSMKEQHKSFILQRGVVNKSFNYIKFVDILEQRTLLFFLDNMDKCTFVKYMCDYSYLKRYVEFYDKHFTPDGNNRWLDEQHDPVLEIDLVEEEWYFTLRIQQKK
jgi:hypothetical protein